MTTGEDPRFVRFRPVPYSSLNARGKENRNFAKVSAVLCDYGFATVRLSDDYRGADFLAIHPDGTILRCQLKGRISIAKKYLEAEDLWIVFPAPRRKDGDAFYVVPHDVPWRSSARRAQLLSRRLGRKQARGRQRAHRRRSSTPSRHSSTRTSAKIASHGIRATSRSSILTGSDT